MVPEQFSVPQQITSFEEIYKYSLISHLTAIHSHNRTEQVLYGLIFCICSTKTYPSARGQISKTFSVREAMAMCAISITESTEHVFYLCFLPWLERMATSSISKEFQWSHWGNSCNLFDRNHNFIYSVAKISYLVTRLPH